MVAKPHQRDVVAAGFEVLYQAIDIQGPDINRL